MSGIDITATVDLSYTGFLTRGTLTLVQTPRGSLPAPFVMDSYGRLSVPAGGGSFNLSVTVLLSRSVTQGATGNLLIRGIDSTVPALGSDPDNVVLPVPFDGGGTQARASRSGARPNLAGRSMGFGIEFTGTSINTNVAAGSTLTCVLHQEEAHTCTDYDLATGYRIHQQVLSIQPSASAIGPGLGWCAWCHEVVVTAEPDAAATNIG